MVLKINSYSNNVNEPNMRPNLVEIVNKPASLSSERAVNLTCVSEGSRPPAQLTWYKDNRKFRRGKVVEWSNETWVSSSLQLVPLPEDDGSVVKCQADNSALPGQSIEDSFKLDVVSLLGNRRLPPPPAGTPLGNEIRKGIGAPLSLVYLPKEMDIHPNKKKLKSRFDIEYPPVVSLSLGSTLNPHDIKEGDDVYFECSVKANPREHRISWYHNDKPVLHNVVSGIIVSTKSLVRQKVTRDDGGDYSCRATNALGETSSQPTHLSIQYAPVCEHSSPQVLGAQLDEALRVRCSVTANPPDVTFFWQFNNSGESLDVSPSKSGTANGSMSSLSYKPQSERDYGTLSCRGTNAVGRQLEPCVFQIVPAAASRYLPQIIRPTGWGATDTPFADTGSPLQNLSTPAVVGSAGYVASPLPLQRANPFGYVARPSAPRNCSLQAGNSSEGGWLVVRCVAGYDGGLPQAFVLEALDPGSGRIRFNATVNETDGLATFKLDLSQLSSGQLENEVDATFNLLIYARNLKGESERTLLENIAFNDAARRTDGKGAMAGMTLGLVVAAALGAALATGGVALAALCARRRRARAPHKHPPGDMLELSDGGRRYVVAYTIKSSPELKTPDPQPDILNAPDSEHQTTQCLGDTAEWPSIKEIREDWTKPSVVFSAEDLALLDSTAPLVSSGELVPRSQEDILNQNLAGQPITVNNFAGNFSPTLGSPNFVCPNGNVESPFGSQSLGLTGPTLSSGSLAASTLHRTKGKARRREHVIAENVPGPESCV
ncbi:unnamed protein product [Plutella xylostella]|uniref:(diamondback moth) hypothetical protein n=1 Tax=Plutella xylostella TaxID=51655 RepID=A0A8S4G734_PLUXY|nr:unnamed protein product [Plutella xylostella]